MSVHGDPGSHGNESVRFETSDVSTKPVAVSVLLLAFFTLVFTAAAHFVYYGLAARQRASSPEANPLAEQYAAKEPPAPRLQIHPKTDLEALRAAEEKTLSRLAWVDKEKGVVQVPIERAMEMVLAKGFPARQGPVPLKMAPKGIAPKQYSEGSGAPDWTPGGGGAGHGHGEAAHAGAPAYAAPAHAGAAPAEEHGH